MADVIIHKENEVYCRIEADQSIIMEMSEHFSFFAEGYKFQKKYKMKIWDGKIRLLHSRTGRIYAGLVNKIQEFCEERDYVCELAFDLNSTPLSVIEFDRFIETLNLPFEMRDYQKISAIDSIRNKRRVLLSPTASGKSLIIYSIIRFLNLKTLLIVPTTALVYQMYDDFEKYSVDDDSWNVADHMVTITGGKPKDNFDEEVNIVCSTWQSIFKQDFSWYQEQGFEAVILDEAHQGKAASITSIMEKLVDTEYRIGTTGTLDDISVNKLTLEGLFGKPKRVVETSELIASKTLSDMQIKCILFNYGEEIAKNFKMDYQDEIDFIVTNKKRNDFIVNLVLSVKGNSIVFYNLVERHGIPLYKMIKEKAKDKEVFFVSGDIKAEERELIRKTVEEKGKDCIIVASLGTMSTGTNIVALHNVFFTHPTKAKIKLLQSIGRGLRKGGEKMKCTFFDFADDLRYKKRSNYTFKHFSQRLKIYIGEQFSYKLHKVSLANKKDKL